MDWCDTVIPWHDLRDGIWQQVVRNCAHVSALWHLLKLYKITLCNRDDCEPRNAASSCT